MFKVFFFNFLWDLYVIKMKLTNLHFVSESDIMEFLEAYPSYNNEVCKKPRSISRHDVHPDTIKTAVYIKHLFMVST